MSGSSFGKLYGNPQKLCFREDEFTKDFFSIDKFLREHKNKASLEVLRDDLGAYLKTLRTCMIELINKDYEDFVNLSTDLIGLEKAINNLQVPLEQLKEEVMQVKMNLEETITGLLNCLEEHKMIRERKKSLQHLAQVYRSLENLQLIIGVLNTALSQNSINLDMIERAAMEYNQLRFSMSKCQNDVPELHKNKSEELSQQILDILNAMFLEYLCEKNVEELSRCLRIYASLDQIQTVEEVLAKEVVSPALHGIVTVSSLHKDGGLNNIYSNVIQFIDTQLKEILDLTCFRDKDPVVKGYNFIIHSLWPVLEEYLELHLSVIFAPGNPEIFHARYTESMNFLTQLEMKCGSQSSVLQLRKHPQYIQFIEKWKLSVYFKIRFQEIAAAVEAGLNEENLIVTLNGGNEQIGFHLKSSVCLLKCMQKCWRDDIFIPELSDSFWQLTLQMVSRYFKWMESIVEKKENATKPKKVPETVETAESATSKTEQTQKKLDFHVCLYIDTSLLVLKVRKILEEAQGKIPQNAKLKDILAESSNLCIGQLESCLPLLTNSIVQEIVDESVVHLKNVNDIPRKFNRTNRGTPKEASAYVANLVATAHQFYKLKKGLVSPDVLEHWLVLYYSALTNQFYNSVNTVLTSVQKFEDSLRVLKRSRDKNLGASETKTGAGDDDKIRQQLLLDVLKFSESAQELQISTSKIERLNDLVQLVQNSITKSEKQ